MAYTIAGAKESQMVARVAHTAKEALDVAKDMATLGVRDIKIRNAKGATLTIEEMEQEVRTLRPGYSGQL